MSHKQICEGDANANVPALAGLVKRHDSQGKSTRAEVLESDLVNDNCVEIALFSLARQEQIAAHTLNPRML